MINKLTKTIIVILSSICSFTLFAQIATPYNMNFEEGELGSAIYGWTLGNNAIDSGFIAVTSADSPFKGNYCAKIINQNKKKFSNNTVGGFFQRLDASLYLKRTIRFTATVKMEEYSINAISKNNNSDINIFSEIAPLQLFLRARNKHGDNIATAFSENVIKKGWLVVSVELSIPENANEIRYGITFSDTNDFYVDNCSIEIISNDSLYYEAPQNLSAAELLYLLPFANISGCVQYFHPSKVASEADWDKVLLTGLAQSNKINTLFDTIKNKNLINKIIEDSLQTLFACLAPQIIVSSNSNQIKNHSKNLKIDKHPYLFAWQHTGVPSNLTTNNFTESRIVDLNGTLKYNDAVAVQYIPLKEAQNKELAISLKCKLQSRKGSIASISVRFEDEMGDYISFIKKDSIGTDDWNEYTLQGIVPDNCTNGLVILTFRGYGKAFFDEIKAMNKDGNFTNMLSINNFSFEQTLEFNNKNWMTTNETYENGYLLGYSQDEKSAGKQSLCIFTDDNAEPQFGDEKKNTHTFSANNYLLIKEDSLLKQANISPSEVLAALPIFVQAEFYENKVSDSLNHISYETYPISKKFEYNTNKPENFLLAYKDRTSRIAMVIKIYNLLKNFSLTEINKASIDSAFIAALKESAICNDKNQFKHILQSFLDIANDNRARVWYYDDDSYSTSIPFNVEAIEKRLFITYLDSSATNQIAIGDEIISINNKNINEIISKLPTNSMEWQIQKLIASIKLGAPNSKITMQIKKSNGSIAEMNFTRSIPASRLQQRAVGYSDVLNDSIAYIDLTIFNDKEINAYFDSLAKYKHFIFDLRGETMVSENFISLLYDKIFQSSLHCVPYFTRPERSLISYHKVFNYYYPAETKHFEGNFCFLINWKTYGKGELFASTIKQYGIGKLIGQSTQGTLAAGVAIRLDADFSISLGTMYGYSPSGEPLLNSPIQPDLIVDTPNKITEDVFINAAIDYFSTGIK